MKLKLIVSLSLLGFVSLPTFAKSNLDYKNEGVLPVVQTPSCVPCAPEWFQPYVDQMTHNMGRAKPTVDCNKPISVAGGINFDWRTGNRGVGYNGENTERFSLNDAYVDFNGRVNEWVKAFVELSYNNATDGVDAIGAEVGPGPTGVNPTKLSGMYSNAYPGSANSTNGSNNLVGLQQGYITFADFNQSPIFVQVGRQFQDYGYYKIHPMTRSLTQVLTETLRTSVNLGFLTQAGFHGQVYTFDTPSIKVDHGHSVNTWGAALGFDQFCDQLGWGVGVGYISNVFSVNDVDSAVKASGDIFDTSSSYRDFGYQHRVSAWDINGHVNSGPFTFTADYTASQRFSPLDLPNSIEVGASGAKLRAFSIMANYGFNYWCKNQNLYVGYQTGRDLAILSLPKNRWLVGWNVDAWKNANIGLEYTHDNAYANSKTFIAADPIEQTPAQGVQLSNSNTFGVRAAVQFG